MLYLNDHLGFKIPTIRASSSLLKFIDYESSQKMIDFTKYIKVRKSLRI